MPTSSSRRRKAGKAILCEKPVDLASSASSSAWRCVEKAGVAADDRLQPPLRSEFRRAAEARSRDGEIGDVELVTIISRDPGAAAGLLHRALGRPVPRHDDPRFRHGALPARRGARRGPCASARRWSTRRSARPATSTPPPVHDADRLRQDLPDLQFAPRHLWLRPAHRGARLEGHAARRQRARDDGRARRRATASPPTRSRTSSSSATPPPTPPRSNAFIDAVEKGTQAEPQRPSTG